MTETHTPLPCPFCGGEAKTISPLGFGNVRAIECCNSDDCAATGPWACNEAEALIAWNTRAVNSHHDLVEALRHVTACLVDELGNLADENEVADEDLAAVLGIDYARQIIAARLRIRQARAILTKEAGHG